MPINIKYKARYEFGASYHIYNRTSAQQLMFKDDENHMFFLEKFHQYLGKYAELLSLCLIPNHFHFLIRIRKRKEIHTLPPKKNIHSIITRQFKNFFICYSMSMRKTYELSGNIFSQKYKHIRLYTEKDIRRTVLYIHRNPKHHNIGNWKTYRWSSYIQLLVSANNNPSASFVFSLFGGREDFERAHLEFVEQGSEPLEGSEPCSNPSPT